MIMTEHTKVRMLAAVAGTAMPDYGLRSDFSFAHGETPTLHPKLASAWVACGHAEPIKEEKKVK